MQIPWQNTTLEFTVQDGFMTQRRQVERLERAAREIGGEEAVLKFRDAIEDMNLKSPTPQTGYDVPRGDDVDKVFVTLFGEESARYIQSFEDKRDFSRIFNEEQ